jgi:hypothetical protein
MTRILLTLCLSLFALFGVTSAHADVMPLPGGPKLSDCNKARDVARCEARVKARQACSDKRGDSKRMCMDAYVVSPDCARSDTPNRCIAQRNAEQVCHGKLGKEHKTCVQAELKKKPKSTKTAATSKPKPASTAATTGSGKTVAAAN